MQSLSRSTYSKIIPENTPNSAAFFSFFDVVEKLGIVIGTLSFGLIGQITGYMRNSILSLIVFFILGLGFLLSAARQASCATDAHQPPRFRAPAARHRQHAG
ncbi:MAG: MFS transporter [Hymenobacter sp.]